MGMDRWVTLHNVLPKVGSLYNVLFNNTFCCSIIHLVNSSG